MRSNEIVKGGLSLLMTHTVFHTSSSPPHKTSHLKLIYLQKLFEWAWQNGDFSPGASCH